MKTENNKPQKGIHINKSVKWCKSPKEVISSRRVGGELKRMKQNLPDCVNQTKAKTIRSLTYTLFFFKLQNSSSIFPFTLC